MIEEFEYTSNNMEANISVIRAMNEIVWWEQMKKLMPMVAKELVKAGVKFPESKPRERKA